MTISQAFSNAAAGLSVASRATSVVSSNLSNAMNENYARREIEVSSTSVGTTGTGARLVSVTRATDAALTGDRRLADAATAGADATAVALTSIEKAIGTAEDTGSLADRISSFETALIDAASAPHSESRLDAVLIAAQGVAAAVASVATSVQSVRSEADATIARQVAAVNDSLARIEKLNDLIFSQGAAGRDVNDLLDQRQALIDSIAAVIPIREITREGGKIAIYSVGGLALLDGRAAVLGFSQVAAATPEMTLESGALSGLTLNGRPVATSGSDSPISGGSLAAEFVLRDETAPAIQREVDALARNLVERFSSSTVDPTLAPGAAGLFTDAGSAFTAAEETGLALRISVNALADPDEGGELWRLRDGLGAAVEGDQVDGTGLNALLGALTAANVPASGSSTVAGTFSQHGATLLSRVAVERQAAESDLSFHTARADTLRGEELAGGVDSDQEMQKLLLIEKTYAANARLLQVVDSMLTTLLEI